MRQANFEPVGNLDLRTVNWDLSNVELIAQYGWTNLFTTSARQLFGRPKIGSYKTRNISWPDLDWEHQNDNQLARKLRLSIHTIRLRRAQLNAPPSPGYESTEKSTIVNDRCKDVDWKNVRDIELARKWGISRERVRQIRQQRGYPYCQKKLLSPRNLKVVEWLKSREKELSGLPLMDIFRRCPIVIGKPGFIRLMEHHTNIKPGDTVFGCPMSHPRRALASYPINWKLPSSVLCKIWNVPYATIAIERSAWRRESPKWDMKGFRSGVVIRNPLFQQAVTEEIRKAREVIGFDATESIDAYFKYKSELHNNQYNRLSCRSNPIIPS